jgi:hypothetical protein
MRGWLKRGPARDTAFGPLRHALRVRKLRRDV